MRRSALYYTNTLSWIFIVLANLNNNSLVKKLLIYNLIPSQPVFALTVSLAEKQQIPIL
jgi:hypothetical protein